MTLSFYNKQKMKMTASKSLLFVIRQELKNNSQQKWSEKSSRYLIEF